MAIQCASAAYLGNLAHGARAVNQKRGARGNANGFSLAGDQNQGTHSPLWLRRLNLLNMTHIPPFHLAFPVRDVQEAREFYVG